MSYTSHMEIMMRRTVCFVFLTLLFQLIAVSSSIAADVAAKGGGVPVGTIVAWPVAKNPEDMDNWLECNGQTVNATVYPELFALTGPRVPDLRGLFLRGYGEQTSTHYGTVTHRSGALGEIQGDAIRDITSRMSAGTMWGQHYQWEGAMSITAYYPDALQGGGIRNNDRARLDFKASRVVPTADENRPVNQAVRYFIRAKS